MAAASAVALFAAAAFAQEAPPPAAARVVGLELDRAGESDRLLVLMQGETEARVEESGAEQLVLHIANATLDPKAPRQLVPGVGSAIREVSAADSEPPGAEVLIRVRRAPGLSARLSQQDGLIALELARPARAVERVTLRLKDAPLAEFVRRVQQITHKRFVYDERLQGSVTVIVTEAVTPGEALEILHATLIAKGFAAVPAADGTLVVLPIDEARARAPLLEGQLSAERAALITALVRFQSADAAQLVSLLQPFAGASLSVAAYPPTNGAILVGSEAVLQRWLGLARSLDETSHQELVVIRPRYRTAAELLGLLDELVRDPLTGRARAELFLDERTNALIVRAEPAALAALRAQVAELDVAPEYQGEVAVIRPRFADPEALAKILQNFASGGARSAANLPREAGALDGANFTVALHAAGGALLIAGDAASQRLVRGVIEELDREPPTIHVELQVLEVKTAGELALGFDAFIPTTDPANPGRSVFGIGVGDPFDTTPDPVDPTLIARWARNPFIVPIIGPGGIPVNVALPRDIVQLKAAGGEIEVRTLMRPHLMTLSGEEHEIVTGLNVPVPSAAAESAGGGAAGDPLSTRVSIERQDVGLRLRVKPVAGQAGDVRLAIDLDVTNLFPSLAGGRADIGPTIERRTLQAHTRVDDGGVAVLAMLLEKNQRSLETGAPYLKDVPIAGNLLKQTLDGRGARHLVIAVQARIARSADERVADTIRLRTAHERALARSGTLSGEGWALRVATRTTRADAEALAGELGEIAGKRARVVAWEWAEARRFDVVLSGFADVRAAADAIPALEAGGWQAELVALPER